MIAYDSIRRGPHVRQELTEREKVSDTFFASGMGRASHEEPRRATKGLGVAHLDALAKVCLEQSPQEAHVERTQSVAPGSGSEGRQHLAGGMNPRIASPATPQPRRGDRGMA